MNLIIEKLLTFVVRVQSRLFFRRYLGRKRYQDLFFRIYRLGLYGMNFGRFGGVEEEHGGILTLLERDKPADNTYLLFDVGAHKGEFTDLCLRLIDESAVVIYAFEPSSVAYAALFERYSKNKNIKPYNLALGALNSKKWLRDSGMKTATVSDERRVHSEEVNVVSLDEFCLKHKIDRIHYLKIDVEGYEFSVLEGARSMIEAGRIDFIQFEFGYSVVEARAGRYFRDYFDFLAPMYSVYRILTDGVVPLDNCVDAEIYFGANFLAERKFL